MGVKKIIKLFAFSALIIFASYSSLVDSNNRLKVKNDEVLVTGEYQEVVTKSINSSVRVISSLGYNDSENITSTSSGIYLVYEDKAYVLTAAHSLIGACDNTVVIADEYAFQCIQLIYLDPLKDIGIMEVEQIYNRKPININKDLCTEYSLRDNVKIREKLFYTGYPQGIGPLTFDGAIVSDRQQNDIFFVHSYAWSGSSGSGVFNSRGKLIGIVTAVSVANSEYGIDVMEDLIIITSITLADLENAL